MTEQSEARPATTTSAPSEISLIRGSEPIIATMESQRSTSDSDSGSPRMSAGTLGMTTPSRSRALSVSLSRSE